jgi:hypothetical protein
MKGGHLMKPGERHSAPIDWRVTTLQHIRTLIVRADPDAAEEVKWVKPSNPAGVPVWTHDGILCTGETYKDKVKLTFAYGAGLSDPHKVFNGDDKGQTRRSIDIRADHKIDEAAFMSLVRAAVDHNQKRSDSKASSGTAASKAKRAEY